MEAGLFRFYADLSHRNGKILFSSFLLLVVDGSIFVVFKNEEAQVDSFINGADC